MKKIFTSPIPHFIVILLALLLPLLLTGCGSGGSDTYLYSGGSGGGGTAPAAVKGIILSQRGIPLEGAKVTVDSSQKDVFSEGARASGEAYTDSDGLFQIQGLSPGTYLLKAEKTGFDDYSNTVELSENAVTFEDITMTVSTPRGVVTGQVTDETSGKPLENVTVTAGSIGTRTGTEGYYLITGLTPGTVSITASKAGYEPYTGTVTVDQGSAALKSFTLKALTTSGSVAGMVTDQNSGAKLQGATVIIGQSSAATDVKGTYLLTGVDAGQQTVSFTRTGYKPASATVTVIAGKLAVCNVSMAPEGGSPSGAIVGLVTDKDWGMDLEDVIISIGALKTSTNDRGLYLLNGVPPGSYTLTAQKTGYQNYSGTVEVKAGEVTSFPIELVLKERTGWVYGDVTVKGTGEPIQDALVTIGDHNTTTDDYGFYDLTGIPEGEQEIMVIAAGYVSYQGKVTVPAGKQGVACRIEMTPNPKTAKVFGRVTDLSTGEVLPDAVVTIGAKQCLSGSDGEYAIDGLDEKSYEISAVKNGYDYTPETIVVTAPATEKNIKMTPRSTTGEVDGTVIDTWKKEAIPGAIVIAGFEVATTDRDGRYRIGGLPAGTVKIYAIKHAYWIYSSEVKIEAGKTTSRNIDMTPLTLKGTVAGQVTDRNTGARLERALVFIGCTDCRSDAEGNYSLDVLAGPRLIFALKHGYDPYVDLVWVTAADTLTCDIRMTPFWDTGEVTGVVTDSQSGSPLENAKVAIGATSVLTDGRGYFELDGIIAGTRTIIASKAGYAGYTGSVAVQGSAATSCNFSMTPYPSAGSVSGTVTDSVTQRPVEDATVSIEATKAYTDSEGRYRLAGIAIGSRTIRVVKTGYQSSSTMVTVVSGTTTCNVTLAPESTSGSIEGTVTDAATGQPIRDAEVRGDDAAATTSESGRYSLAGLPAGECMITVTREGYTDGAATVTVRAGETVTKDFALSPSQGSGTLQGTVTDSASGKILQGVLVVARGPDGGQAYTDKSGFYKITGLSAGTFTVEGTLSGYNAYSGSVSVASGSTVTHSFTMTVLSNKGTLKGTVTDSSTGASIAGARVTYADRTTETDTNGNYELVGVQPGNRDFSVTRAGYADVNEILKVQPGETVTKNVQMTPLLRQVLYRW
ncbi:MAG: carboxypeptidase regulatory-like domain-containing protein [Candidatus Eremiobacteraeota bacterium]|nr:carboxypeptidase regulatory-like domain-containing protein [Candidatus Eremiobacteraeota bacterium]